MEQAVADPSEQQASTVRMVQLLTIGWMCVELVVALFAGIRACSVALTAFGAESAIELIQPSLFSGVSLLGQSRNAGQPGFLQSSYMSLQRTFWSLRL